MFPCQTTLWSVQLLIKKKKRMNDCFFFLLGKHLSVSPAVSDRLAARSALLLSPALRANAPPVFSLSGVNLEEEVGAVRPH